MNFFPLFLLRSETSFGEKRESIHLLFPAVGCCLAKVRKCLALTLVRHEFDRSYCISGVIHLQKHFPLVHHA